MAASMRTVFTSVSSVKLIDAFCPILYRHFNPTNFSRCLCTTPSRFQGNSKKLRRLKQNDPRLNTQYPFVMDDPVQEAMIANLDSTSKDRVQENQGTQEKKIQRIKDLKNVFRTNTGLVFEKITEGDIRLGRTLLQAKASQPGSSSKTILLEGVRLIRDALLLGAEGLSLYFTDPTILDQLPQEHLAKLKLYKILYRDMKTWSDTATPSGLLGIFQRPNQGVPVAENSSPLPITVVLDSLKDPGNVGTLIRTAAAVGCKQILAIRGSVNLWEGKVLRSSMGAHFSIPLYWGVPWSDVSNYLSHPESTQVLLADTRGGRTLTRAFDHQIDMGTLETREADDSTDSEDSDLEEVSEWKATPKDSRKESAAYDFHKVPMPVFDYTQIPLTAASNSGQPDIVLVLGGETEGLSGLAKQFAFDHYGHYVTIPMASTINSLNTGVAGSVLLYELRRLLMQHVL